MSSLDQFLNAIVDEPTAVKHVASKRIKDATTGKPLAWTIQPLDEESYRRLRSACQNQAMVNKDGRRLFDQAKFTDNFTTKLAVACTADPDLNNAALQDKYKVKDAENLLRKMLGLQGEMDNYIKRVQEVNGFESLDFFVAQEEEAKNE